MRLAVTENIIFRKMISGWPQISPLTRKWISPLIFTSIHFRKERERERERERETAQIRERGTIAPRRADERRDRRSHSANERRGAWSRSSIERSDRRSTIAQRRRARSSLVGRSRRSLIYEQCASDERARRSHRSIDDRAARRRSEARSSLSLSDLGSLFSLLSLIVGRAFCRIWCIFW